MPNEAGLPPTWGTKPFPKGERSGSFVTLASGIPGDDDALPIRTDARMVAATIEAGKSTEYRIATGRKVYLVPATGKIDVNGVVASAGDGVAISDERLLKVSGLEDSEIVLVDVA
jgi:redox-sensitive bicupin YhaK (pirin superfamily)